jgi:hypothetical protein
MFNVLYMLRRLFFVFSIVFLPRLSFVQVSAQLLLSDFLLLWLLAYRPFEDRGDNALEVFNEATIALTLMVIIGAFMCTPETGEGPEVMTREMSERVGLCIIWVIVANMAVNTGLFAWSVYTKVIRPRVPGWKKKAVECHVKYCKRVKKEPQMTPEDA